MPPALLKLLITAQSLFTDVKAWIERTQLTMRAKLAEERGSILETVILWAGLAAVALGAVFLIGQAVTRQLNKLP